jgi:hypothetical protein
MSRGRVTGLAILAVAAAVIVYAALTPVGGWAQSFAFGTGVRWQDAYRALDALEPAIRAGDLERRRVAWAQAEDEPPAGMAIGPRIHPSGVLARLKYETFDTGGAPMAAWEVRALVPRLPDITPPKSGPHPVLGEMGCPAECEAELKRSHGTLITRSGQPGIAGEWVLRMPVGGTFELGRRPLVTWDIFADIPLEMPLRSRREGGRDIHEPAAIRVTLLDVCRPRVRVGTVTRLALMSSSHVPLPRGFETTRWVQLDGCA